MSELQTRELNEVTMDQVARLIKISIKGACVNEFHSLDQLTPYVLIGPPGIGKTDRVKQAVQELVKEMKNDPKFSKYFPYQFVDYETDIRMNPDSELARDIIESKDKYFVFVDLRLNSLNPSDISIPNVLQARQIKGISVYDFGVPLVFYILHKHPGVLFLDEFTNLPDEMGTAVLKLLQDRQVGTISLHKGVLIIAAGNDITDSNFVNSRLFNAAVTSRVKIFYVLPPTEEEWINYQIKNLNEQPYIQKGLVSVPYHFVYYLGKEIYGSIREKFCRSENFVEAFEGLPLRKRQFSTLRTLSKMIFAYADILFENSTLNTNTLIDISSTLGSLLEREHALRINAFLETIKNMEQLVDDIITDKKEKLKKDEQIAILFYLGELIKNYALDRKYSKPIAIEQMYKVPVEKAMFCVYKLLEKEKNSSELCSFLLIGAGVKTDIINKTHSIMDDYYIMSFLQNVVSEISNIAKDRNKAITEKLLKVSEAIDRAIEVSNRMPATTQEFFDEIIKRAEKHIDVSDVVEISEIANKELEDKVYSVLEKTIGSSQVVKNLYNQFETYAKFNINFNEFVDKVITDNTTKMKDLAVREIMDKLEKDQMFRAQFSYYISRNVNEEEVKKLLDNIEKLADIREELEDKRTKNIVIFDNIRKQKNEDTNRNQQIKK